MATDQENLRTARSNYAASLAELSNPAKRKLNYSIGGRSISWTDYQRFLLDSIKAIDEQLAMDDGGFGEVISVIQ